MEIRFELPFPPSVNRLWRFSGKRMYLSKKYAEWRKTAIWEIKRQFVFRDPITSSYSLTLLVRRPDKRKRDLDNLFKAISDALVDVGVIEDHNCVELHAKWVKDGPECLVILEDFDGQAQ